MSIIKKIYNFLYNPAIRFGYMQKLGMYDSMSDENFLKRKFNCVFGYNLDLNNPVTFNEKLQWLKLYNHNPQYTMLVDKYKVRSYVAEVLGEEYLIPLLGVWDTVEKIDFNQLPNKFVLKCNHNSGLGMCICKDKSKLNIKKVKKELRKGLKENYYLNGREWPYKNVPKRIIAEEYMENGTEQEGLNDYKFYCFDGKMKMVMINSDRFSDKPLKADYFDREYRHLDLTWGPQQADYIPKKPEKFEEMCLIAEKLSKGIPHVRVDLYLSNGKIYFGELTFFDGSGFDRIVPEQWDHKLGNMIKLPKRAMLDE